MSQWLFGDPPEAEEPPASAPAEPPRRVFIVDDHAYMRQALATFAAEAGLEVCGMATSGAEALERVPAVACDLVLVDVSMPGMSGIELVRRLREAAPGVPCLVTSGHAEIGYVRGAMEAGARGYVTKGNPFSLLAAIQAVLDGGTYTGEPEEEL